MNTRPTDYSIPTVCGASDYSLREITLNPQRYTERTVNAAHREQEIRRQIVQSTPAIRMVVTS